MHGDRLEAGQARCTGSKWPVSNCALMLVASAAHGVMLAFAVEYSGWKLNGVPLQSAIEVS